MKIHTPNPSQEGNESSGIKSLIIAFGKNRCYHKKNSNKNYQQLFSYIKRGMRAVE
jgi:hypothetical protein